jgi:hypothetical protein
VACNFGVLPCPVFKNKVQGNIAQKAFNAFASYTL